MKKRQRVKGQEDPEVKVWLFGEIQQCVECLQDKQKKIRKFLKTTKDNDTEVQAVRNEDFTDIKLDSLHKII